MKKDAIRINLKEQRNSLSLQEQQDLSHAICSHLLQTDAYNRCNIIFPYLSFGTEVDTKEIIRRSLLDGKRVYIPRVEEGDMEFYEIRDLEGLILSNYGILEPSKNEKNRYQKTEDKVGSHADNKLMLLPGLAFDPMGNRIGYGAGYYDKYLLTYGETHFYKIALAYDFQIINQITSDEFDVKVDAILTPTRFMLCNREVI